MTEENEEIVQFLIKELRDFSAAQTAFQLHVDALREDVGALLKAVRDGNGVPSLLNRVDRLEERQRVSLENVRGKWALAAASVAGFTGIGMALVALFK